MSFADCRITGYAVSIKDQPDRIEGKAAALKALFDARSDGEIKEKHNALVGETEAALAQCYTAAETDAKITAQVIALGTGDMARGVYDPDGDGKVSAAAAADTAERLASPRRLGEALFDGSADLTLAALGAATAAQGAAGTAASDRIAAVLDSGAPVPNAVNSAHLDGKTAADFATAAQGAKADALADGTAPAGAAAKLAAVRKLGAAAFDGSADVSLLAMGLYPVGSLYLSAGPDSPAALFGGSWTRLKDRFLLAAGDSWAAGSTGGEAAHVLAENELPAHSHAALDGSTRFAARSGSAQAYGYGLTAGGTDVKLDWTTGSAGGGAAHNNLPPYLAVYVWQRVA